MRDYKKIKAYQLSDILVSEIYELTAKFPREEAYGLISQLRRAVVSVPANIVEGSSRQHKKEYLNFLYISRASLAETEYLFNLSSRLNYIDCNNHKRVGEMIQDVHKVLYGLIEAVNREV